MANLIAEELNYNGRIIWDKKKIDGTPKKLLDVSRINKLGWYSKISLREGIKMTINSFKSELQNNLIKSNRY